MTKKFQSDTNNTDINIAETVSSSLNNLKLSRDNALTQEIAQVRQVNQVLENVINSLDISTDNLNQMRTATNNANQLLNLWVKIMSQAQYTQELLENPQWQGATMDEQLEKERVEKRRELQEKKRLLEEQLEKERIMKIQKENQTRTRQRRSQISTTRKTRQTRS